MPKNLPTPHGAVSTVLLKQWRRCRSNTFPLHPIWECGQVAPQCNSALRCDVMVLGIVGLTGIVHGFWGPLRSELDESSPSVRISG